MTTLPSAAQLVRQFGAAKKSLGQCFLTDPNILARIADLADLTDGDHVIEIGPGPGSLTRAILATGASVRAIELDSRAVEHLARRLVHPALEVVEANALKVDESQVFPQSDRTVVSRLISNLPYNVATEIFFRFERFGSLDRMVLMFQREVAKRFVATVGEKAYGPLAILPTIRWIPRLAFKLPPGAFTPSPKVHSAVVVFERRAQPRVSEADEPRLRQLVRTAFQKRRKTLRNALEGLLTGEQIEAAGVDPRLRPERLPFESWLALV